MTGTDGLTAASGPAPPDTLHLQLYGAQVVLCGQPEVRRLVAETDEAGAVWLSEQSWTHPGKGYPDGTWVDDGPLFLLRREAWPRLVEILGGRVDGPGSTMDAEADRHRASVALLTSEIESLRTALGLKEARARYRDAAKSEVAELLQLSPGASIHEIMAAIRGVVEDLRAAKAEIGRAWSEVHRLQGNAIAPTEQQSDLTEVTEQADVYRSRAQQLAGRVAELEDLNAAADRSVRALDERAGELELTCAEWSAVNLQQERGLINQRARIADLAAALRSLIARIRSIGGYATPEEQDVLWEAERVVNECR